MASLNDSQLRDRFQSDFSEAFHALLKGETGAEPEPFAPADFGPAGMVVFFGECIRGAFLVAQRGVSSPGDGRAMGEDWLGEMANQLAGRVKSCLSAVGIDFVIVPPLALHGAQLSAATATADCWSAESTSDGQFHAWALLNIIGPIPPIPEADAETGMDEGDFILF